MLPPQQAAETTHSSQMDRPSTAEAATLLRNNTTGSKAKPRTTTVHQPIPPQQEKHPISALFSRSQPYRESNTPPLNAAADKLVADWPYRQLPQPTTSRFSSKEKYSSVHFKGLAGSPKAAPQDTSRLASPSTDYTEGREPSLMYGH